MLRVPGIDDDLLGVKAPRRRRAHRLLAARRRDARAARTPTGEVVFFAVGFETTAPANAMAVAGAERAASTNFSVLVSHVLVPPAMEAILLVADEPRAGLPRRRATSARSWAGREYEPLAARYQVPIVVTGFEPLDLLRGHPHGRRAARGRAGRASRTSTRAPSRRDGNPAAQRRRERGLRGRATARGAASARSRRAATRLRPSYARLRRRARVRASARSRPRSPTDCIARRGPAGRASSRPTCPAFGDALHARASARRDDGLVRGRLRGLLPLREGRWPKRSHASPGRLAAARGGVLPVPAATAPRRSCIGARRRRAHDAARSSRASSCRRFDNPALDALHDGAILEAGGARLAFTTDSLRRPARCSSPAATSARSPCTAPSTTSRCAAPSRSRLSAGFILEEGLPMADLRADRRVDGRGRRARPACRSSPATRRSSTAARATASTSTRPGVGRSARRRRSRPGRARAGDVVLVSGAIGDHGIAVMSAARGPRASRRRS